MATVSQRQKGKNKAGSSLKAAIGSLNLAKETSKIAPVKAAFDSVSVILTTIKESMINEEDYVELGLNCADICRALDRGTNGKKLDDLNPSVREAINQLTATVTVIQRKLIKHSKRNWQVSGVLRGKGEKKEITTWKSELNRILHVFNTELAVNTNVAISDVRYDVATTQKIVSDTHNVVSDTHGVASNTLNIVSDIHRTMLKNQGSSDVLTQTSPLGEPSPPPPRTCFGRKELIEQVIGLVEGLKPIALIGPGGIGKTSIALTVLHDERIKQRFGDHRRFIRCDQFPASLPQFLSRISEVVGAGIENPENLTSLQPFLSSTTMIIFFDNVESILDPQGPDAQRIYAAVEELTRFGNICVGITSRISTVPPRFKRPTISTLSMDAACDIFYDIYDNGGRSDVVKDLIKELDFHALSITLLATTASHNMWDYKRLTREWNAQRTQVLRTDYNESLAATIELSLRSPSFRKLGPHARDILGVVAFFPQGIDEDNLEWLFPTVIDRKTIFDKFCVLSLTSRHDGFVTMLAPIRDHLCPRDPASSTLLCTTRDRYFTRLSVEVDPETPEFAEARWIASEDANVEHLLNVFMSVDIDSDAVWEAVCKFIDHLYWHKSRYTVLGLKIEGLPDDHRFKPMCLVQLSRLADAVGNFLEQKRYLTRALELEREWGDESQTPYTLICLSGANKALGLHEEGIEQVKEALAIYEKQGVVLGEADCWSLLARLLNVQGQFDEAEEAAFRALDCLPEEGQEFRACQFHRGLGSVYISKCDGSKAIYHFGKALEIASAFDWSEELFWINHALSRFFLSEQRFEEANAHIDQAKVYTVDGAHNRARAMESSARIWTHQDRFVEATSELLGALEIYENLGASEDVKDCRDLLRSISDILEPDVGSATLGQDGKDSGLGL